MPTSTVNQVSFHLRSLAKAGLITEASEHARDRRDRVWVPTSRTYRLSGPGEPVSQEDEQVLEAFLGQTATEVQDLVRRVLGWATDYAAGRDREHRGAATQETVRLTVAEMRELCRRSTGSSTPPRSVRTPPGARTDGSGTWRCWWGATTCPDPARSGGRTGCEPGHACASAPPAGCAGMWAPEPRCGSLVRAPGAHVARTPDVQGVVLHGQCAAQTSRAPALPA